MTKLAELMTAINLIATDLENQLDPALPTHERELYARPPAILPDHCPMLVVFTESFAWDLVATPSHYFVRPDVRVGWFVAAAKESETADGFEELMLAQATIADRIADRLTTYSEGLPGQVGTYAKIIETTTERSDGPVFGFVHRMELER
ncbi:MAG: hypothetical protein WD646_02700 [Actinomycetota bacterium]